MVWSLALCPDDAKQDPVVYGAEFGIVFRAEGSRTAFIQEELDFLVLYHSDFEGERYFRLIVEPTQVLPDAHPACAGLPDDFNGHVRGLGDGAS